jgi:2-C-methyl-D-erythritol 2,4-cyclodiphosphate synthase
MTRNNNIDLAPKDVERKIMIGFGYDTHRLAAGETLILGGIRIESEFGTVAHSDGDAVLHALTDALLGAAALGDIGEHFPDIDSKYKDADSGIFVKEVVKMLNDRDLMIGNIDLTIVIEKPNLQPYKTAMKANIAQLCNIEPDRVNIKAKTAEMMGHIGRGEGIEAYCVCEVVKK